MNTGAILVRGAMALNPFTAPFAQMWGEFESGREQERLKEYCDSLQKKIMEHEVEFNKRMSKQECSSEEIAYRVASLERIIDCLVREFESPKVELLAQVTVNCIIDDSLAWEKKIRAIDSFRQITIKDIAVLKQFSEKSIQQVQSISGDTLEGLVPSLCKLSSLGLISEIKYNDSGPWTPSIESDWKTTWPNKYYELLPSGQEFLKIISE